MRKTLWKIGPNRASVRGFTEDTAAGKIVRVQWRVRGLLRSRSWDDSTANRKLARAFAEGLLYERTRPQEAAPGTIRDVWDKYVAAEFPHLRPRTRAIYTEYWRRWENMWGAHFPAEDATIEMLREMRNAMAKLGLSINTIRGTVKIVKMVYAWAQREKLLTKNELHLFRFKVMKEQRPKGREEFRAHEFDALLAALDPKNGLEWRPYVALAICGFQGARQNAVLHLQWDDIDLETGRIYWRPEWDKMGRDDWSQPLRKGTIAALEVAATHRKDGNPWVLPSRVYSTGRTPLTPTYTAQSLWAALKSAQRRADVPNIKGRGAHGLRRLLAGEVQALTGDPMLAMHAIGDTDVRQAERYVRRREDRITAVFKAMDNPPTEEN